MLFLFAHFFFFELTFFIVFFLSIEQSWLGGMKKNGGTVTLDSKKGEFHSWVRQRRWAKGEKNGKVKSIQTIHKGPSTLDLVAFERQHQSWSFHRHNFNHNTNKVGQQQQQQQQPSESQCFVPSFLSLSLPLSLPILTLSHSLLQVKNKHCPPLLPFTFSSLPAMQFQLTP